MFRIITLVIFLIPFHLISQDSLRTKKTTFYEFSYGFGVERREGPFQQIHEIDTLLDINRTEVTGFNHSFSFGYMKRVNNWFNIGGSLSYGRTYSEYLPQVSEQRPYNNDFTWTDPIGNHTYHKLHLSAQGEIDLLWKKPDDALLLHFGVSASYFERHDVYEERIRGTNDILIGIAYRRTGRVFRPFFGMEWEEYLGKHWGYRIGFSGTSFYNFNPERVEITNDVKYAENFDGQTISRGNRIFDRTYLESIPHIFIQAQVSVVYRL